MRVGWIWPAWIAVCSSAAVVSEIGKEERPVREKLALEPLVQEPEQQLPGMNPVAFCPIAEVARPVVA